MGDLTLIPIRASRQPRLVELPIWKENTWVKRHPGYEMLRHPVGGLDGHSWADWLLPSPFGVLGRRIVRAFLGWLASGPSPFGALGLGQLARGAQPGPMVPTTMKHSGSGKTAQHPN